MGQRDFSDSGVLVAVFEDKPGGWLPIGEFGKLYMEMEALRSRAQRMTKMFAVERALWFAAGVLVGALSVALAR